mgnify:CR=1 FL=1
MPRSVRALVIVAALAAAACNVRARPNMPTPDMGDIITRAQIEETGARTMWEALTRTVKYTHFQESGTGTPQRIRRRGASTINLYEDMPILIDQVRVMDVTILASLRAADIERIQVLNGVHATTYFGTNAGDGIILIYTRGADDSVIEKRLGAH